MSVRPNGSAAEMVRVRSINCRFAFFSLRADGWSVTGIMVQRTGDGHRITWPFTESGGVRYPVATPSPALREALERQIAEAFDTAPRRPAGAPVSRRDILPLRPHELARLQIVRRKLVRYGSLLLNYGVATEDEWQSACPTLEHRDACIDLMAGIGSVRLRPTPSGVGVDLTEDSAAATPTPGAALGDEGAF